MRNDEYFGVYVNKNLLKRFRELINRNYYRGKLRKVIENFMEKYIKENCEDK